MRQLSTRERQRERREFVNMFKGEILQLCNLPPHEFKIPARKFIDTIARPWLQYNRATYWFDIYLTFQRDLKKLIDEDFQI